MDSFLIFLVAGVFIALFIALAYHSYQEQKKRLAALTALSQRLGWPFSTAHDSPDDELYSAFDVFSRGHSQSVFNTFDGSIAINGEQCRVRMGDFRYRQTSGSGKSRKTRTYVLSYILVRLPYNGLPTLTIRDEGIFDTVAGAFGFDDIDFESAEFSKRFHVSSSDKRFAYDVIHPAMIEFLMGSDPPVVEVQAHRCCVTDDNRTWSAEEFAKHLAWVGQFFALWPKHLVATLKSV